MIKPKIEIKKMDGNQKVKKIKCFEILILLTVLTVFLSAIYRIFYAINTFKKIPTEIKPWEIALLFILIVLKIVEIKKK